MQTKNLKGDRLAWQAYYHLTPIGGWAPVYIAQKIKDNRFQVAGGEPGMEVSWQVTDFLLSHPIRQKS